MWQTRQSPDKPFSRPGEIAGLEGDNAWVPCLSADGLTLYFYSRSAQGTKKGLVYCSRKDKESPWSKAKAHALPGFEERAVVLSLITPDGLTLFGLENNQKPSLLTLSRSSTKSPFQESKRIEVNNRPLFGFWPRYVSATQELFFVRIPLKEGSWDKTRPVGIWVSNTLHYLMLPMDLGSRNDRKIHAA